MELTLEEVVTGVRRTVEMRMPVECETCAGSGGAPGHAPGACETCDGAGEVRQVRRSLLGQIVTAGPCPTCSGLGTTIDHPCAACRGDGRVSGRAFDRGRRSRRHRRRQRLRLAGRGPAAPRGGTPGDLFVAVRVAPNADVRASGRRLRHRLPVSIVQAALGADGGSRDLRRTAEVDVQSGTQPGARIRIHGLGVPSLRNGRRAISWSRSASRCRQPHARGGRAARAAGRAPRGEQVTLAARRAVLAHPVRLPTVTHCRRDRGRGTGGDGGRGGPRLRRRARRHVSRSAAPTVTICNGCAGCGAGEHIDRGRRAGTWRRLRDRGGAAGPLHVGAARRAASASPRSCPGLALAVALTKAGALDNVVAAAAPSSGARGHPGTATAGVCGALGRGPGRACGRATAGVTAREAAVQCGGRACPGRSRGRPRALAGHPDLPVPGLVVADRDGLARRSRRAGARHVDRRGRSRRGSRPRRIGHAARRPAAASRAPCPAGRKQHRSRQLPCCSADRTRCSESGRCAQFASGVTRVRSAVKHDFHGACWYDLTCGTSGCRDHIAAYGSSRTPRLVSSGMSSRARGLSRWRRREHASASASGRSDVRRVSHSTTSRRARPSSSRLRCSEPTSGASGRSPCPGLLRLAEIYEVPADQLLPREFDGEISLVESAGGSVDPAATFAIDLVRLHDVDDPDAQMISRFGVVDPARAPGLQRSDADDPSLRPAGAGRVHGPQPRRPRRPPRTARPARLRQSSLPRPDSGPLALR